MQVQSIRLYFHGLAILATFLLWGVSLWNGTVKALVLSVYHGRLTDGTPLQTVYTGIPPIDLPISLLVTFFFYGTNGSDPEYQLFLLDAYSTLQSAFVWLYVERFRISNKPRWVLQPVVFGLLWQAFGAAISLPLYYAVHLSWVLQAGPSAVRPVEPFAARAIPAGFLLGAFLPAVIGMFPTWAGAASRSAPQHQRILAAWQPGPLWVMMIQLTVIYALRTLWEGASTTEAGGAAGQSRRARRNTAWWVRASYLLAAASSISGHLYTKITALRDPRLSLWKMYVPGSYTELVGVADEILAWGPWLFLKWDYVIIGLSSLSWVFVLLCHTFSRKPGFSAVKIAGLLSLGGITIGAGGTVSLALLVRELYLEDLVAGHDRSV